MPNKIGILGFGEIGKSVAKFYPSVLVRDTNVNNLIKNLDFLLVCIPDSDNFVKIVGQNIKKYSPKIVIIHSTVAPGKTKHLFGRFHNVVHSPVRGVHPKLYEGMKTFVKFIGCDNLKLGQKVANHFNKIGIKNVKVVYPSTTTELAKLLDTTYYGLCIAFHAYANKLCRKLGANFNNVMTDFNNTYNDGYVKLGKSNVVRPVLFAPQDGIIGGHCVISNAQILQKQFGKDPLLTSMLRHKKRKL